MPPWRRPCCRRPHGPQTDESLGIFNESATLVFSDDGNSTAGAYTNATYWNPFGLASDDDGRLIVSDYFRHRVVVFDDGYKFSFPIGKNDSSGRPASGDGDGEFNRPVGVAVNSTGHIFVADRNNNRIQIFSSDGTFVGMFNESSSGKPARQSTGGPGVTRNDLGDFTRPADVAISHDEKLIYVTAEGDQAVYHFNASTYKYVNKTGNRGTVDGPLITVGSGHQSCGY